MNFNFKLQRIEDRLSLIHLSSPEMSPIFIDFTSGKAAHRRKQGGGRNQAIAKAVGLKQNLNPTVLDATAGFGQDAFVLASLGCRVHMIERNPIISQLLEDGLNRAKADDEIGDWVCDRLSFEHSDSLKSFSNLPFHPDVIYLDPMFPEKTKSALVKKNMQIIQHLAEKDTDADELLPKALKIAQKRVVVKRPATAKPLSNLKPDTVIETKKNRFDIYFTSI